MVKGKLRFCPEVYWLLCVCLLILPWNLVFTWILSVTVHEFCHYLALKMLRCEISGIKVGITGIKMSTEQLSPIKELICAAAGPMGGLLLFSGVRYYPILAIVALLHSMFNLIPLFPLDGGRIVHSLVCIFFNRSYLVNKVLDGVVILVLLGCAIYLTIKLSWGVVPLVALSLPVIRNSKKIFLQT